MRIRFLVRTGSAETCLYLDPQQLSSKIGLLNGGLDGPGPRSR
jgi:hypothetical protein